MYKGGIFLKISKELLKGSTTMLVLNLLENENMYGYQMIKTLSEKSENIFELKEGTLYPILHSLEESNLITSYWDETTSKKRKYYSITKEGKKILQEKQKEWRTFSNGINKVIGGVSLANW
jgi:PadR family transcriptional regulator PadR